MRAKIFYDATAERYDERHKTIRIDYMRGIENAFLERFAKGRVLDVGCGTGQAMRYASEGIDVSSEMLKHARIKGFENLLQADAEELPFKDGSFDTVLCIFTVLNLCDCRKAVKEMNRVLRKGGIVIISTASVWDHSRKNLLSRLLSRKRSHILRMRIEKFRFNFFAFTKRDLIELFAGFRLLHFYGAFLLANTYWGWQRDFSVAAKVKLKTEFFLEKILQPFNRAARMYFAAFEKE